MKQVERGHWSNEAKEYYYAKRAAALGVRNFFLEVHPNPDDAPSDGPNMVRLDDFEEIINEIDSYSYSSTDW